MSKAFYEGKFRYNGADLVLMKKLANTQNAHEAVEAFIEKALSECKDPQQALKEAQEKENSDGRST